MPRTLTLPLFALLALLLFAPAARADDVQLISGFVERSGRDARFTLTGPGFRLGGGSDLNGPTASNSFFFNTITDAFGSVTFNGVTSMFFRGGGSFTDTAISGTVTAFPDFFFTQPPLDLEEFMPSERVGAPRLRPGARPRDVRREVLIYAQLVDAQEPLAILPLPAHAGEFTTGRAGLAGLTLHNCASGHPTFLGRHIGRFVRCACTHHRVDFSASKSTG